MDNENTQLREMASMLLNWDAFMDPNLARNSDCFDSAPITDFTGDPGFAERAAKFSCFGSRSFNGRTNNSGKLIRVSSTPALKALVSSEFVSTASPSPSFSKAAERKEDWDGKRQVKEGKRKREEESNKSNSTKPPEPPKDYIHVRARRGQATDSHSLAERVRREKIGERMKLLQDLVPNCNNVTGKALMLDEIINYVQSLQRQVEFLSMKLSSANDTSLDFNVEPLVSKDIMIPSSSNQLQLHEETLQSESSNHHHNNQQLNNYINNSQLHANISSSSTMLQFPINSMETSTLAGGLTHLPTLAQFTDSIFQYHMYSDEDLQSIVGMGVAHNSNHESQNMKIEL